MQNRSEQVSKSSRRSQPQLQLQLPTLDEGEAAYLFERMLVWLLLLAIIAGAAFVFLGTLDLVSLRFWTPFGGSAEQLLGLRKDPTGLNRLAVGAGSLVVGLLFTGVLLRRVGLGGRRRGKRHILSAGTGGMVVVESRGVCTVAEAALRRIPGVMRARVQVSGEGAAPVRLKVILWVSAAAELKEVGEAARLRAGEAVQTLVGIEVHGVVVRVEVVPLDDVGRMLE